MVHLAAFQTLAQVLTGGEVGFGVVDMGKDNERKASRGCSETGQAEGFEGVQERQECILPCLEEHQASQQQVHLDGLLVLVEAAEDQRAAVLDLQVFQKISLEKSNLPRGPQKLGVLVAQVPVEGRVDQN